MKYLLTFFMVIGLIGSVQAADECFTGSWYDPTTDDGRGIDIQVLPNDVVAGFFYTWYGNSREVFVIIGDNDSDTLIELTGHQSLIEGTYAVGNASLDLVDNNTLIFSYNWQYDMHNTSNTMRWCQVNCQDSVVYKRLTQPIPCEN